MSILDQLKERRVFRVAAVYAIVAWGILQVLDVIGDPLGLPEWFATAVIVLLGIGFPIALVLGWAFNMDPEGITHTTSGKVVAGPGRGNFETVLLVLVIIGLGWLIMQDSRGPSAGAAAPTGTPIVILMDTFAARGVYDDETRRNSGTNADVLSDVLQSLPILTQKETIGSTWDRENQVILHNPTLVVIHRSGFFHSMYQDMGFVTEGDVEPLSGDQIERLYNIADNKLGAFLGAVGNSNSHTKFLVYSRGTGPAWVNDTYREEWVATQEGRFPSLAGRITAIAVPGGVAEGSFRNPETAAYMKDLIGKLALEPAE